MNLKAGIGATLAAFAVAGWLAASVVSEARVEAKLANDATQDAIKHADNAEAAAGRLDHQVVVLTAQRDSAVARAGQTNRVATRLMGQLASLEKAAPDTCRPIIVTADSALAAKDLVIAQQDSALAADTKIERDLHLEVDTLRVALTTLSSAAKTEVKVVAKLTHRSWLVKLLPTPGIGVAAGLNPAGSPQVITGITLGWHL